MSADVIQDARLAFEHWYSDQGKHPQAIERKGDAYVLMNTHISWTAWQELWLSEAHKKGSTQ